MESENKLKHDTIWRILFHCGSKDNTTKHGDNLKALQIYQSNYGTIETCQSCPFNFAK